ncbi:MAG: hypothetical protein ABIJ18_02810 [archaeon]
MKPNYNANNDKNITAPPSFRQNWGRLARLPREERIEIARKGGLARSEKKRLSSQLNPIKTGKATSVISITNCDDCQLKRDCDYYKEHSACQIEINIRRNTIQQFKALAGNSPEDMLGEMAKTYMKLERIADENPTFYNLLQQVYLLMKVYELKFGRGQYKNI